MKKLLSLRSILVLIVIFGLSQTWQVSAQALIKDFIVGPNTYHNITTLVSIKDSVVYLTNDYGFWKTDGTCDGTVLVKEFEDGYPSRYTPVGGEVFFRASDPGFGSELWRTGGTGATTFRIKDIYPGTQNSWPDHFCVHHNILYFTANNSKGEELWRSDGTDAGTSMVIDLRPGSSGSNPYDLVIFKDTLFFVATTSIGPALWKSDGTDVGTKLVKDFVPSSTAGWAGSLVVAGNTLFLKVNDNVHGTELWASDGSTAGTVMVKDINPGSPAGFSSTDPVHARGNVIFFSADNGVHGKELWTSNGTEAGTYMIKDLYTGTSGSYISEIIQVGNILYFDGSSVGFGDELWRSDGTESGTYMIKDIEPAPNSGSAPKYLTPMSDGFYFRATENVHGNELWWSDGTAGNTVLVKDIWPGQKSSTPSFLARIKEEIVFVAEAGFSGEELWSTGPIPSGPPVAAQVSSITHENCSGDWMGAIDITVTSGDCPIVFQWLGPFNNKYYTEDLSNLRAGVYNLTITDGKGSTQVLSVEVTQPPFLSANYLSQSPPDCLGNLGTINIAASGGTPPYEYLWDNGVTGPTITDIPFPGDNFTVSITDANGCVYDWGGFGTHAELPYIPNYQVNHPISCYNDLAYIFEPEGVKPAEVEGINTTLFQWEAGPGGEIVSDPTQQDITVRGAATYYVTVTASSSSCTETSSVEVSADFMAPLVNAGPDVEMTCSTEELVLNATVSASGPGNNHLQVHWEALDGGRIVSSPFEVTPAIDRPGTYVLTVRNQYNGCTNQDTVIVTAQFEGPKLSVLGTPLYCDLDEIALLAVLDTSLATFDGWYTAGGLYTTDPYLLMPEADGWAYVIAKASNTNGCVTEIRVDLLRNAQLSFLSLSADTLGCGGVPIKIDYHYPYENMQWVWTGPNGYYHYGEDAHANDPGFYYLQLTVGSCMIFDTIEVVGTPSIQIKNYQITAPSCNGNDGQIVLYDISGAWSYNIVWSNGATGAWNVNLAAGQYWVGISSRVDFSGGCYIQEYFSLPYPDTIELSLVATPDTTGTNTGTANSIVSGIAPPPYLYQWSNGATTASITGLAPGTYTLTVTYNLDYYCTVTASVEVLSSACLLAASETFHQNNACPGEAIGQIAISTSNGTAPFDFLWSNGASTATLSDLASGTYSLTVTDAQGCSTVLETEIITQDTLPPVLNLEQPSRYLDEFGQLTLTAQDFDAGSFDNCSIVSFTASPLVFGCEDLGLRVIDVTATDAAGNVTIGQTTLILHDNVPPILTCPENIVVGYCAPVVSFALPEVDHEACAAFDPDRMEQLKGLSSGSTFPVGVTVQTFRYTKLNVLADTCSFTVTVAPEPSDINIQASSLLCYGDCNGSIDVQIVGGSAPFTYTWSTGQTSSAILDLCSGTYEVTIYDSYQCGWTYRALVQSPPDLLVATDVVLDDTSSMGVGAIYLLVTGGVSDYTFHWYLDTLQLGTTQNLEGLFAGDYYCVVTDANGCTVVSEVITVDNFVATTEPGWATGFMLIPNPASTEVQVKWSGKWIETPTILVFDDLGRPATEVLIRTNQFGNIVLDVSSAAPGMYWVQLVAKDGRVGRKLVVAH